MTLKRGGHQFVESTIERSQPRIAKKEKEEETAQIVENKKSRPGRNKSSMLCWGKSLSYQVSVIPHFPKVLPRNSLLFWVVGQTQPKLHVLHILCSNKQTRESKDKKSTRKQHRQLNHVHYCYVKVVVLLLVSRGSVQTVMEALCAYLVTNQ